VTDARSGCAKHSLTDGYRKAPRRYSLRLFRSSTPDHQPPSNRDRKRSHPRQCSTREAFALTLRPRAPRAIADRLVRATQPRSVLGLPPRNNGTVRPSPMRTLSNDVHVGTGDASATSRDANFVPQCGQSRCRRRRSVKRSINPSVSSVSVSRRYRCRYVVTAPHPSLRRPWLLRRHRRSQSPRSVSMVVPAVKCPRAPVTESDNSR